jgi:prophage maintenance system killer protein
MAAAYGFGLACSHPIVDGNKRAALQAVGVFLAINVFYQNDLFAEPDVRALASAARSGFVSYGKALPQSVT